MKVQVLVHQLANRFQPAQVNLQASQRVIAVAVQLARVKVQVQAHQSAIQDPTVQALVTAKARACPQAIVAALQQV
ncbi:hypothetical protein [Enterococcus avium]|uniref:hypothetical protein n=1 Tax=Enterococcus avium TaxID=33945 RepID=UPI001A95EC32|nr:hypothetical protein [Enterococcus avium]